MKHFLWGWVWGLATRRRLRADGESLRRMEYRSSVQRLGVRFTERIRAAWRGRWWKVHR